MFPDSKKNNTILHDGFLAKKGGEDVPLNFFLCKMKNTVFILHERNLGINLYVKNRLGQKPPSFWLQLPSNRYLPANTKWKGNLLHT